MTNHRRPGYSVVNTVAGPSFSENTAPAAWPHNLRNQVITSMAYIRERMTKTGKHFYELSVNLDGEHYSKRWYPPDGMSKRKADKEVMTAAVQFEADCKSGKIQNRHQKNHLSAKLNPTLREYGEQIFMPCQIGYNEREFPCEFSELPQQPHLSGARRHSDAGNHPHPHHAVSAHPPAGGSGARHGGEKIM